MEHVAPLRTSKPYRQVSDPEHHRENPAGHVCWMGARPVPGSSPRCPGRPCTGASPFGSVDQPPFVVVPLTPHLWLSVIFLPPPPRPPDRVPPASTFADTHATPILFAWFVARKKNMPFKVLVHLQKSARKMPKSILHADLCRMQLTLHTAHRTPHGASAWCTRCLLGR